MTTPSVSQQDRRKFLGASDIAAVLGLDPWRSPRMIWTQKTAPEVVPDEPNEDTERGILKEPVIAVMAQRRLQLGELEAGAEYGLLDCAVVAHPDRVHEDGVLELKAPRRWTKHWGQDGTDEAPDQYLVQIQVQMLCAHAAGRSVERSWVVAECGELRCYPIRFDLDTARRIVDFAVEWWERHVVRGEEPPAHTAVELNTVIGRRPGVQVGPDLDLAVRRLRFLRTISDRAEQLAAIEKEMILRTLAADTNTLPEVIDGPDGKLLATIRRGGRTELDKEKLRREFPEVWTRCQRRIEWNELRPAKNLDVIEVGRPVAESLIEEQRT